MSDTKLQLPDGGVVNIEPITAPNVSLREALLNAAVGQSMRIDLPDNDTGTRVYIYLKVTKRELKP